MVSTHDTWGVTDEPFSLNCIWLGHTMMSIFWVKRKDIVLCQAIKVGTLQSHLVSCGEFMFGLFPYVL